MSASDWPVTVDPVYFCWLWEAKRGGNGRPVVWRGQRPSSAYRVVYEAEVGPVPEGLVLDHRCNRSDECVNPAHMDPVTERENQLRKSWRYRLRVPFCNAKHDTRYAMNTSRGGRVCRLCR